MLWLAINPMPPTGFMATLLVACEGLEHKRFACLWSFALPSATISRAELECWSPVGAWSPVVAWSPIVVWLGPRPSVKHFSVCVSVFICERLLFALSGLLWVEASIFKRLSSVVGMGVGTRSRRLN